MSSERDTDGDNSPSGGTAAEGDGASEGEIRNDGVADTYAREALAEDARTLVSRIEAIHADPYRGYDGRIELHRRLEETIRDLPETATAEEFYRRAAPLVAGLADTHSKLCPPDGPAAEDLRLPVSFRVVEDGLYVDAVYEESLRDLLGGRLRAVDGQPVDAMVDRGASLRGAENRYTALLFLRRELEGYGGLDRLLDRSARPEEPTISVAVDGEERRRPLEPVPTDADATHELPATVDVPSGGGPRYRLYEGGEAAVFVPGNLTGYRESLKAAAERDASFTEEFAREAHAELVDGDPPDDTDELLAVLPSMLETLIDLACEMESAGTETLIVDLRDNPGGDSRFVFYLCYVLYGWDGVLAASSSVEAVKRRTALHRERYGLPKNASGEFATVEDNPADYDFSHYLREREIGSEAVLEQLREAMALGTDGAFESESHAGHYAPEELIVVTTAATMSSAFAGAAQLSELGGDLVGVPSGQAPISFGEAVEVTLPNTGLCAEIAGSTYRWVSDPEGPVLSMDRELTAERFEQYGRAGDAALRLAFDYADLTEPGERPTPLNP